MNRTLATALTAAGLTATAATITTPAHAQTWAGVGRTVAYQSANCPGINPYLNDGIPSPTCAVMGGPVTLENRQPGTVHTTPGYGWVPPMCYFVSHRWDGWYNPSTTQPWGQVQVAARAVENWDGVCGGATVPLYLSVEGLPVFDNIYGVGGWYPGSCRPFAASSTGAVAASSSNAACAGHTYAGALGDWERGYYTMWAKVTTPYTQFQVASTHQVY